MTEFFVPDEPVEVVLAAYDAGDEGITVMPPATLGAAVKFTPTASLFSAVSWSGGRAASHPTLSSPDRRITVTSRA